MRKLINAQDIENRIKRPTINLDESAEPEAV